MDTETFKILYSGSLAYTMFITNILIPNGEKYDYILEKEYYNAANFSLVGCILLATKEDVVKGSKDIFETKIFYNNLLEAINFISTKKSDGYYIDNHKFKDPASIVGELRNKIAHGNYTLDAKNGKVTFKVDEDDVSIDINTLAKMIISCFKSTLKNPDKNIYKRQLVFSNKVETKRTKTFKDINEALRFASSIKLHTFTFKRKDNQNLTQIEIKLFENFLKIYEKDLSPETILEFEKKMGKSYIIEIKPEKISYDIIKSATEEAFENFGEKMEYLDEVSFLTSIIENKRKPKMSMLHSQLKNILILQEISKDKTKDINKILKSLKDNTGIDYISYNELVAASIALFQSLFCYGNDTFLKNNNEYTNLPNDGLDYGKLDLSKINVLYLNPDETKINDLLVQISGKNKKVKDLDKKIAKSNTSLKEVIAKNNTKAAQNIQNNIISLQAEKQIIESQIKNLYTEINDIETYKQNNDNHLTNRLIINAIRNSISHGNYMLKTTSISDIKIVFEDVHKGKLIFKCEIDIIDLINMLYENKIVIDDFLNNQKSNKLTRKIV